MTEFNNENVNTDTVLHFNCRQPKLKEALYTAIIDKFELQRNCPTKYGLRDRVVVTFNIIDENLNAYEVINQSYLVSNYPGSMFDNLIFALFERHVGSSFRLNDLNGKECLVKISHFTKENGDTFDNVEYVRKMEVSPTKGKL